MNNWNVYTIKDICKIKSGKRLPKGCDFSLLPTNHPYIRSRDIKNGKIFTDNLMYISEEVHSKIKKYIVEKEDVLITIVANIGDVGFVEKELSGYNLTENAVRLTDFNKNISSRYLCYYLSQPSLKSYMEGFAVGAAQAKLGIYKIEKLKVQIPPLPTQQKIASMLSTYDNLIQNYKKQIEDLQTCASELYKEWFVRFRFPGYKTTQFENGIPVGWKVEKLGDFINFERGVGYSSADIEDGDYVLLSMNNIKPYGGFIRDYTRPFSGKYKDFQLVKENDLIMSITDMTQDRRIIGYVGMIPPNNGNLIISTHLLKISSQTIPNDFLFYHFNYSNLSRVIAERATGTNVLGLTSDILKKVKTLFPSMSLVNHFSELIQPINKQINNLNIEIDNLTQQRDLLLPRLMSGKLEVE